MNAIFLAINNDMESVDAMNARSPPDRMRPQKNKIGGRSSDTMNDFDDPADRRDADTLPANPLGY
ncbi:hypothetical protein [Aporhodopirellula aestuarii]|uniref:Uncharacterized protein n=1 Tax=Aporhodopirellula aestuarii TaxID=2950107 RepID=A0ABT0U9F7_9BACT|nr:hypothetical protein [Aporhodopirellula aestuarii]MCM2373501.1 hypothetical protein [Aporhodopirellula aestuarii]